MLNAKAARLALEARKKREDRAHVEDVIGGWGPPGRLPKTEEGEEKRPDDEPDDGARGWLSQGGAQGYEKRLRKVAQRGGELLCSLSYHCVTGCAAEFLGVSQWSSFSTPFERRRTQVKSITKM